MDWLREKTYNNYLFKKYLGSGRFSETWLVELQNNSSTHSSTHSSDNSSNFMAAKVIRAKYNRMDHFEEEIDALKRITRPDANIPDIFNTETSPSDGESIKSIKNFKVCKYIDSFIIMNGEDQHNCIVLEKMETELAELIENCDFNDAPLSFASVKKITMDIVKGLQETHNAGVIHTDLKPENIMMSLSLTEPCFVNNAEMYLKLCCKKKYHDQAQLKKKYYLHREIIIHSCTTKLVDFGNSLIIGSEQIEKNYDIGTPNYRAPELILRILYNEKIDMWALGCVIYEMITGGVLFCPEKDNTMSLNSNHLAMMIKTFGEFYINEVIYGQMTETYFVIDPLLSKRAIHKFRYLIGKSECLKTILIKHWKIPKKEAYKFWSIMEPLFKYNFNERASAIEYLDFLRTVR